MPSQPPYQFAFGQPVQTVHQQDRTPKRVFILGKYASAVHARWVGSDGKTRIQALAVASEPYIFWRGDGEQAIINRITLPAEVGRLVAPAGHLNGPSGMALDDHFITPLGLTRDDVWLCDLVPHSLMNPKQQAAIQREYVPLQEKYSLPSVTVPPEPKTWADDVRRAAILDELRASEAKVLVTLGDDPLRWFVGPLAGQKRLLGRFGKSDTTYGRLHTVTLGELEIQLLPLVHPRQAGRLGAHSKSWAALHDTWQTHTAGNLSL